MTVLYGALEIYFSTAWDLLLSVEYVAFRTFYTVQVSLGIP